MAAFYRRFSMRMLVFRCSLSPSRVAATTTDGETRFRVRIALALSSVAMPNGASTLKRAGQALDREIDRQILPDGGHISRNPRVALSCCSICCRCAKPTSILAMTHRPG